ncbi:MAG: hypothetical protein ACYDH9_00130 [Limisphaerales bacterium]
MAMKQWMLLTLCSLVLAGCATTTVETRKKERQAVYDALPPDLKKCVDNRQVKVGMSDDAVYIAWGQPSEILHSGDQNGEATTWIYYGSYMQETPVWAGDQGPYGGAPYGLGAYPPQYLTYVYNPRDYVKAELVFVNGKLASWHTLPKPLN